MRHAALFLAILALIALFAATPTESSLQAPDGDRIVLASIADTFIESGGTDNHGAETTLQSGFFDGGGTRLTAYVRFDLTGVPPDRGVASATLRLFTRYASGAFVEPGVLTGTLHAVTSSWDEMTLGGNGAPPPGDAVADGVVVEDGHWTTWDVTDAVREWLAGHPNHGVAIVTTPSAPALGWLASFDSREGEYAPQLVVELEPDAPSAPLHAQVGGAMNVAVTHEGVMWLGVGPRLVALDVTDAAAPVELGRTDVLPAVVEDLATDPTRSLAWLAAGGWLVGIDIADPRQPAEIARLALPVGATRIALAAGHAWLMLADNRVAGVDLSDPVRPRHAAEIPADVEGFRRVDLAANENQLYLLLAGESRETTPVIQPYDVTRPATPHERPNTFLDGIQSSSRAERHQIEWIGDKLWLRTGGTLLAFIDSGAASWLDLVGRDTFDVGGWDQAMAISGNRAYVSLASGWSDNYGVAAFDISDPNDISVVTLPDWEVGRHPGVFSRAIAVSGEHVWVASSGGYLTALDTNSAKLDVAGAYASVGEIERLNADGGHLYALSEQSAQSIDVQDPAAPEHAGLLSAGHHYRAVAADDGVAGLALWGQSDMIYAELQLVDVSNPRRPRMAHVHKPAIPGATTNDVAMDDGVLALAVTQYSSGHVELLDVADPRAPSAMAKLDFVRDPRAITLADNQLVTLTEGDNTVVLHRQVLQDDDISGQETTLTDSSTDYPAVMLAVSESHAFGVVEHGSAGPLGSSRQMRLHVVDVSRPDRLDIVGDYPIDCAPSCRPVAVAYHDDHLFLGSDGGGYDGVIVIDVTDVAVPRIVQTLRTRTGVSGVHADGEWLYAATGAGGLYIIRRPTGGWGAPLPTATPSPTVPTVPPTTPSATPDRPSPPTPDRDVELYLPALAKDV